MAPVVQEAPLVGVAPPNFPFSEKWIPSLANLVNSEIRFSSMAPPSSFEENVLSMDSKKM